MSESGPDLFLVERYPRGGRPDEQWTIPEPKTRLLMEGAQDEGDVDPKSADYQSFLEKIYERGLWIACGCREGEVYKETPPPLLTVQQRERFALLRLHKRPSHQEGCPLEGEGAKSDPRRREGERVLDQGVCFHRRPQDRTERREEEEKERNYRLPAKRSTLERTLYTLLEQSNQHRTDGSEWDRFEAFKSLASTAEEITLADTFKMQEFLHTRPWEIEEANQKVNKDWERWPDGAQPHAIFVFQADRVKDQTVIYDADAYGGENGDGAHQMKDELEIRSPETSGPYVFLMTVTGTDENPTTLVPTRAFGIPIVSEKGCFPVMSEMERNILLYLGDQLGRINQSQNDPVQIKKPLFIEQTALGDCRPDLSLHWREKTIAVRLIDDREVYQEEIPDRSDEAGDRERLGEIGIPCVIETEGESGYQLIRKVRGPINEKLKEIKRETGGQNLPTFQ